MFFKNIQGTLFLKYEAYINFSGTRKKNKIQKNKTFIV